MPLSPLDWLIMTQHPSMNITMCSLQTHLFMVDNTSENLVSAPVEMVIHDEGLNFSMGSLSKDSEVGLVSIGGSHM